MSDLFAIHDVAISGLDAAGAVSGADLVPVSQSGVNKKVAVSSLLATSGSGVSGAAGAESLTIGNNILKKGTKTLVPADGASDSTVTFGVAFPTGIDNIQLTIRSCTSVTLKQFTPTPNTLAAGSFKIHIDGGDASSTASVDWLVWGH